jgi:UDP-GlcNAc:undecaprenyl-phosphate GlcNAc-1-phosphate transferase
MRVGHGHRRSVLILWAWTALLSGFVLYPTITGRGNGVVPIGMLAIALLLFTVLHPSLSSRRAEVEVSSTADEAETDDAVVVDLSERRSS